ncbi:hypothetical protein ARMGADRAFT_540404 [Armillaria gallica]|uniref:Uncharacterized protein n=1 Tax=Armillaria gallica TaxID=47427 RepID=A0A2H3CXS7_ARMGA|nr:hypothetical protein ARMGADRAFT_540404 [Armillaria gallica]
MLWFRSASFPNDTHASCVGLVPSFAGMFCRSMVRAYFLYVSQCLRLGGGTTSSLLAGFRRITSIYYYLYQHCITNIFKVPRKVSLLRETYATMRSKRYEPLRPRRMACHVRAVDPAVPNWDLAPVHTTTTTTESRVTGMSLNIEQVLK